MSDRGLHIAVAAGLGPDNVARVTTIVTERAAGLARFGSHDSGVRNTRSEAATLYQNTGLARWLN
eukprot:13150650-Alexandrium_andersonii.AAC.1